MKPLHKLSLAAAVAFLAGACAIPPENLPRSLDFAWTLTPDETMLGEQESTQGEILLTWDAKALPDHRTTTNNVELISSRSGRGTLYCGKEPGASKLACFEDRDGDGKLDWKWRVSANSQTPKVPVQVVAPAELTTPRLKPPSTGAIHLR